PAGHPDSSGGRLSSGCRTPRSERHRHPGPSAWGFLVFRRTVMPPSAVHLSSRAVRTADQPISYFMQQAVENPHLISLAAGLVDAESPPAEEVAEAAAALLGQPDTARAALQYGTTQGLLPLRRQLLTRTAALDGVTPEEMGLGADDVVVTTGSQQLLYLL